MFTAVRSIESSQSSANKTAALLAKPRKLALCVKSQGLGRHYHFGQQADNAPGICLLQQHWGISKPGADLDNQKGLEGICIRPTILDNMRCMSASSVSLQGAGSKVTNLWQILSSCKVSSHRQDGNQCRERRGGRVWGIYRLEYSSECNDDHGARF